MVDWCLLMKVSMIKVDDDARGGCLVSDCFEEYEGGGGCVVMVKRMGGETRHSSYCVVIVFVFFLFGLLFYELCLNPKFFFFLTV
jgi:hypothetical protein